MPATIRMGKAAAIQIGQRDGKVLAMGITRCVPVGSRSVDLAKLLAECVERFNSLRQLSFFGQENRDAVADRVSQTRQGIVIRNQSVAILPQRPMCDGANEQAEQVL
jgi:hypothetical protein